MRAFVLVILVFSSILIVKAQTVYIPDSVFKAYLLADTTINTNMDTEIQISEAVAYTGIIDISNLQVSDITGIEAFTAISKLYCSFTLITTIDLSNNSSITELHCEHGQISSIDVSNCISLLRLDCYDNQISSLNMDNCPALTWLDCCANHITSIDVSNCSSFNTLFCCSNQLTSLNVKNGNNYNFNVFHAPNNPNLLCIEVDDPAWSSINWTDKDSTAIFSTDCNTNHDDIEFINDLKIFPNPFTEYFNISITNNNVDILNTEIIILNLLGEKQNVHINKTDKKIRIYGYNLNSGLYIVKISDHKELNAVLKIIKK